MATALRPDSRRVAEATPAAMTAAFLFEAAVSIAAADRKGGGAPLASIDDDDDVDAGSSVPASKKKKRAHLAPSAAALSHSLSLAAGKLSRSSGAPLPRGASHALCGRCGKVLGGGQKDETAVRPLSRSCRRRRRRAAAAKAATAEPCSSRRKSALPTTSASSSRVLNTVELVVSCGACGHSKRPRGFYTRELAEAAAAALRRGS